MFVVIIYHLETVDHIKEQYCHIYICADLALPLYYSSVLLVPLLPYRSFDGASSDFCVCVLIPEIDLSDNNLGDYGARAIAGMLKENSTLVSLNLSGNHFTDKSAEHLGPALITNTKLQRLNLSYNTLGENAGRITLSKMKQ